MKQAGNDTKLIEADGNVIGVLLAANYTAEHEFGIRHLLNTLNIDPEGRFLEGRSMQSPLPDSYQIFEYQKTNTYYMEAGKKPIKAKEKALAITAIDGSGNEVTVVKNYDNRYKMDADIAGAWDGNRFAIIGWTDRGRDAVKMIDEGIKAGDLSVWLGGEGGNPFARSGLIIVRTSMVPPGRIEEMRAADQAQIDLAAAANATGIIQKLEKINRRPDDHRGMFYERPRGYHALAPAFLTKDQMDEHKTKHNVRFYLNPCAQSKYNYGWFTVEELEQWIEDSGPVVKTQ